MKVNYHTVFKEELEKIGTSKPSLLLHVCCGPCSSNIIQQLSDTFNITIYYSNSNIYPEAEYQRRYQELITFIANYKPEIQCIEQSYEPREYLDKLSVYSDLPEGSKRCHLCYSMRMHDAYQYANVHNFDYWTTVMSVSRHKNSQWINEIGASFPKQTSKFLFSDFKKENGYMKSITMSKKYNLYRQDYCGCLYSYQDMLERKKEQPNKIVRINKGK